MRKLLFQVLLLGAVVGTLTAGRLIAQTSNLPGNYQSGESLIADGSDLVVWDDASVRIHDELNVRWSQSNSLTDAASVSVELDEPLLGLGCLVYSMDSLDQEQSILIELIVDENGVYAYTMVPMDWERAEAWEISAFGNIRTHRDSKLTISTSGTRCGGWGEFWEGYWYYLTNPSAMDDDLETGFYVSGGIGVGAGVIAGGIVAAPVVAGTTFTIPTIGVTTTTTGGVAGGGLVLGGTVTTVTTGTVTVSGTTVVAGTAVAGGAILMSVDPNKLHHVFDNAGHNLDDFLNGFGGNQPTAFEAVRDATQAVIDAAGQTSGLIDDIIVNVGGTDVTVRGVVIDGVVRIGTFFIP